MTGRRILAWAAVWAAALVLLLSRSGAAHPDGEWLPFAYDAFYHAHRILAVAQGGALPQFDPEIQAPGGTLVTWPWAYDWVLGQLTRLAILVAPQSPPMLLAGAIPPLFFGLSIALVFALGRELRLGDACSTLAAALFALAPLVNGNHLVGSLDHHWAEALAVLAAAWSAMRWQRSGDARAALLHGVLLAAAQGVQNGLFVLQAFSLAALAYGWLRGERTDARATAFFALGLIPTTLALLLPSLPFRWGLDEFYYLGWFHLLAACGTALFASALSLTRPNAAGLAWLGLVALAVLAGMAPQFLAAGRFVAADTRALGGVQETVNIAAHIAQAGLPAHLRLYTPLPLLAPLLVLPMLWRSWRDPALRVFVAFAVPGIVLQALQMRFWSFGAGLAALAAAWCVQQGLARTREPVATRALGVVLVGAALLAAPARDLGKRYAPAGSEWYRPLSGMLAPLREACAQRPRVLLASPEYGHLITYFTRCRVMTNNFIMTPRDYAVRDRAARLFALTPAQLRQRAPEVELVLAGLHAADYYAVHQGRPPRRRLPALEAALLDPRRPAPPGYRLLGGTDAAPWPTHRLYEIVPGG